MNKYWKLIGWIIASPKQRLAILKIIDSAKRKSEELRKRASKYNPCLSRISTKEILKELIKKGLVETELNKGKRFYWINKKGKLLLKQINSLCELKRADSLNEH